MMENSRTEIDIVHRQLLEMDMARDRRRAAAKARMAVTKQELLEHRKNFKPSDPFVRLGKRNPIFEQREASNKAMVKMLNDAIARTAEREKAAKKACRKFFEEKMISEAAAANDQIIVCKEASEDGIAQTDNLVLDQVKPDEALEMVTAEAEEDMEA